MVLTMTIKTMFGPGVEDKLKQIASIQTQINAKNAQAIGVEKQKHGLAKLTEAELKSQLSLAQEQYRNGQRTVGQLDKINQLRRALSGFVRNDTALLNTQVAAEKAITKELERQATLSRQSGKMSAAAFPIHGSAGAFFNRMDSFVAGNIPSHFERIAKSGRQVNRELQDISKYGRFAFDVLQAFALYKGFVFLKTQAEQFVRTLVDMEHQVALVQTQVNDMGGDFRGEITTNVIKIAQETGLAFEDVAAAEFQIVGANVKLQDSYGMLRLAAKAAAAGGITDVGLAFDSALSQMRAFELGVDQADETFDKQFNLIKRGVFTYEQFASVVGTVNVAFAQAGQDTETANAALAAMSQIFTGRQLQYGATALRNVVNQITQNAQAFEDIGVDVVDDATGSFNNFILVIEDLQGALAGMTEQEQSTFLKQFFPDERELRGISSLVKLVDDLKKVYVEQTMASGDLKEAFDTVEESLEVQVGVLKNDLAPALAPVIGGFHLLVSGINDANDGIPGLTQNVIGLAGAVAGLAAAMGAMNVAQQLGFFGAAGSAAALRNVKIGKGVAAGGLGLFGLGTAYAGGKYGATGSEQALGVFSGAGEAAIAGGIAGSIIPGVGTAAGAAAGGVLGLGSGIYGLATRPSGSSGINDDMDYERLFSEMMGETSGAIAKSTKDLTSSIMNATDAFKTFANTMSESDLETAAGVFATMGVEGSDTAGALNRAAQAARGFALATTLIQSTVLQQRLRPVPSMMDFLGNDAGYDSAMAAWMANPVGVESVNLLESLGLDPNKVSSLTTQRTASAMGFVPGSTTEEDFVDAVFGMGESVKDAGEAVSEFATRMDGLSRRMQRNDLEAERIKAEADLQGRALSAEEIDHIKRLGIANIAIEEEKLAMGEFEAAVKNATAALNEMAEATEDSTDATADDAAVTQTATIYKQSGLAVSIADDMYARGQRHGSFALETAKAGNVSGNADVLGNINSLNLGGASTAALALANIQRSQQFGATLISSEAIGLPMIRAADKNFGGLGPGGHGFGPAGGNMFGRHAMGLFAALANQLAEASRRNMPVTINFNGDVVPSEWQVQNSRLDNIGRTLVTRSARSG